MFHLLAPLLKRPAKKTKLDLASCRFGHIQRTATLAQASGPKQADKFKDNRTNIRSADRAAISGVCSEHRRVLFLWNQRLIHFPASFPPSSLYTPALFAFLSRIAFSPSFAIPFSFVPVPFLFSVTRLPSTSFYSFPCPFFESAHSTLQNPADASAQPSRI